MQCDRTVFKNASTGWPHAPSPTHPLRWSRPALARLFTEPPPPLLPSWRSLRRPSATAESAASSSSACSTSRTWRGWWTTPSEARPPLVQTALMERRLADWAPGRRWQPGPAAVRPDTNPVRGRCARGPPGAGAAPRRSGFVRGAGAAPGCFAAQAYGRRFPAAPASRPVPRPRGRPSQAISPVRRPRAAAAGAAVGGAGHGAAGRRLLFSGG